LSAWLARVPHLRVIPPATMEPSIRDGGHDGAGVARTLGANLLLTGTLSRTGETVRVDYMLLDTRHGHQVGGDRVEGSVADLVGLQNGLEVSLSRALQVGSGLRNIHLPSMRGAPAHEQYLRALGYLHRMDDETSVERAITLLEELVIVEGDTARVHAALGRAYERKFRHARQPEWIRKAEASCRAALTLDPHAPEVLVTLGHVLNAAGSSADAVEVLQRALALRPQDPEALWDLSLAYEGLGRMDDAEETARQLVAAWPDYWRGYDRLGMVCFRRGRYAGAIEPWARVVELTPDNANAHNKLGATYFHLGLLEEALQGFDRSASIRPTSDSYIGLGAVQFYLGRRHEAVTMLEKAVALLPRDARAWGNLADVQRWTPGLERQAADSFDRAIELARADLKRNPNDADRWSNLGKWLAKRDRLAEALEAIEKAMALAPEDVGGKVRAATVMLRAGRASQAAEFFMSAARAGYALAELEGDPELESLRRIPEVQTVLEEVRGCRTSREGRGSNHGGR
jgi:tetratricopeptide (TPR) repeat protein